MINELYTLSACLKEAGINTQAWHRKYIPIPNMSRKSPCVEISVRDGKVEYISTVNAEVGKSLRKYGSNQGTFPCMNLTPLYRIKDDSIKKEIGSVVPEKIDEALLEKIKSWCTEDNWSRGFRNKYRNSMAGIPAELSVIAEKTGCEPLRIMTEEAGYFADPDMLRSELEREAFRMLEEKSDTRLALYILFYLEKNENDNGSANISAALNTGRLQETGMSAVSRRFVETVNSALLEFENMKEAHGETITDAFGNRFVPIEEPMPEVKLAGGFSVKIRTNFKEHKCQMRYGMIENASYPIAKEARTDCASALSWLGSEERRNVTWMKTDKNEILFAYPSRIDSIGSGCIGMFGKVGDSGDIFEERAKAFLKELRCGRNPDADPRSDKVNIFILRKIDKARTKTVYSRQTDAAELERSAEEWVAGAGNIPKLDIGETHAPFPMEAAIIMNRQWKRSGEEIPVDVRQIPSHYGLRMLMDGGDCRRDLSLLVRGAMAIAPSVYPYGKSKTPWKKIREMVSMIGIALYKNGTVKENYMTQLPYLYGQLLKISDLIHEMYCKAVRKGNVPPQLVGSSYFIAASENPVRTLSLLGARMSPYITWAKSYRHKNVEEKGIESWRAAWLLKMYETTASQIYGAWDTKTRLNDEEKAQLFIGYLAALPKKQDKDTETGTEKTEGGNNHE